MRAVQAVRLVNILVITMFSVYCALRLAVKMSERPITSFQVSGNIWLLVLKQEVLKHEFDVRIWQPMI